MRFSRRPLTGGLRFFFARPASAGNSFKEGTAGGGTRTHTLLPEQDFESCAQLPQTPVSADTYETPPDCACQNLAQIAAEIAPVAPDLADLLTAWPDLPEAVKAGILAMVKASSEHVARYGP